MKKLILLLIIIALGYAGYAQCSVDGITETIYANSVEVGSTVCSGQSVSIKISDLQNNVTYTLTYGGVSHPFDYSDLQTTTHTWPLGTLTQSLAYTITGQRDECSSGVITLVDDLITVVSPSPSITLTPSTDDPSHVCANSTITLTVTSTPGLTYKWHTSPQIDQQLIHGTSFTPTQPATYWVAGFSQCADSVFSEHIPVNFVPVVSTPVIAPASGPHCVGAGTSTYSATASNATGYTWAITGGGTSTISSGGTITWDPNFAGNAQITATAYGCGGSSAFSQVNVSSGSIAGATLSGGGATCSGAALPLTLTANSGNLDDVWYSLFLDGNFVSQQQGYDNTNDHAVSSITWNKSNVGQYTVTATGNGCTNIATAGAANISLIQPGAITITPSSDPGSVCDGDSFTLTASGGTSYTWHSNISQPDINGFDQGNVHGNTFSPYLSALYWVTGTESNCGTSQSSDNAGVTINPLPDVTISPAGSLKICSTCSQLVNAVSQINYTYQWRKDGENIPGATSASFTANQLGAYSVSIVSNAGCSKQSSNFQLIINVPPTVSASNQTLTLPTNSTTVTAGASDPDGTIASYLWTQVSGSGATTSGALTNSLALSDLHAGSYSFQITVTDDFGETKNITVTVQVNAPPNNYNYVRESSILISGKTQPADIVGLPVEQKNITTTYFDGIGRAMQTVSTQSSPNNKSDIVTPVSHDEFGRENKKYLPYVSGETDGSFKLTGLSDQTSFYNSPPDKIISDSRSFSETIFEPSPLNRPQQDFGPGQNWKDNNKYAGHSYEVNQLNDVLLFTYNPSTGCVSTGSGGQAQYYNASQLLAKRTTDEHGNDMVEYVDKLGHTVCKKVQYASDASGKLYASTYYIYDDFGNLVVVLPPEAVNSALSTLTSQN